jgi:dTMP kinase
MFVSLEGIDGSGKSTQAKLLAEAMGEGTVLVREPGGTAAAERVRELLADTELELDPMAELLLFCAARADLVRRVIRPALEDGRDVVSDRFADSSVAYQGAARGLGMELAERLSAAATDGLEPNLTLLLWIDPETAAARSGGEDRFEAEGLDFQRSVASAFEEIAVRHSGRVVKVDADGSIDEVHNRVMDAVRAAKAEQGRGYRGTPGGGAEDVPRA